MSSNLREALEKLNAVDLSWLEFPLDGDSSTIYNSNKKEITIPYWRIAELLNGVKEAQDMAEAALSAPPRNCDVGTPKEQSARFDAHCQKHMGCLTCPLREKDGGVPKHCELAWAQIPYEEMQLGEK